MGDLKMNNVVYQRTSYKTILHYENRKTLSKVCKSMQLQRQMVIFHCILLGIFESYYQMLIVY